MARGQLQRPTSRRRGWSRDRLDGKERLMKCLQSHRGKLETVVGQGCGGGTGVSCQCTHNDGQGRAPRCKSVTKVFLGRAFA
eukprot:54615-Eustigmatos_ZCMA.PRE.1